MLEAIFGGIFLLLLAGLLIFKPDVVWFITESWKSSVGSEPSDLYLSSTRFGGIVLLIMTLFLFIGLIIYS
ncbi:DUF6199 family natural product biosynthesis protein [Bacillus sp. AFS017336]|uniref:DUF6199 family natural product biosynthesis protein n=1 Tax=Bacillus sp. AFS017336 TaxID=2033489 RepID=UPI000BF07C45|nr:DUF6199 family natural product biosynthesis protein [Bacillus sp. AFS017336]PEL05840.1 hypothetical protein CN601_21335 [Bacillus sp. AFS017336]